MQKEVTLFVDEGMHYAHLTGYRELWLRKHIQACGGAEKMYERWLCECVEERGWSTEKCAEIIGADPAEVAKDYEQIKTQ